MIWIVKAEIVRKNVVAFCTIFTCFWPKCQRAARRPLSQILVGWSGTTSARPCVITFVPSKVLKSTVSFSNVYAGYVFVATLVIHISGAQWPSCISLAERMAFFGILINMVLGLARWQSYVSLHGWYQHGTSFWSSTHKVWRQGITREDKKRMNCSNDYSRLRKFVKKWEVFVCLGQTSISQIAKHV